jgi:hypothetical protein
LNEITQTQAQALENDVDKISLKSFFDRSFGALFLAEALISRVLAGKYHRLNK